VSRKKPSREAVSARLTALDRYIADRDKKIAQFAIDLDLAVLARVQDGDIAYVTALVDAHRALAAADFGTELFKEDLQLVRVRMCEQLQRTYERDHPDFFQKFIAEDGRLDGTHFFDFVLSHLAANAISPLIELRQRMGAGAQEDIQKNLLPGLRDFHRMLQLHLEPARVLRSEWFAYLDGRSTGGVTNRARQKIGRPKDPKKLKRDMHMFNVWKNGRGEFKTFKELGATFGENESNTRKIISREKRRRARLALDE
jgi:hypothetical protein